MEKTKLEVKPLDTIVTEQLNAWRTSALTKAVAFHQWMKLYKKDPTLMVLGDGGIYKSVATVMTTLQASAIEARDRLVILSELADKIGLVTDDFDKKIAHLVSDEALTVPRLVDENGNVAIDKKELDKSIAESQADEELPGPMGVK